MTPTIDDLVTVADIVLRFGRVERATSHPDGVRPETDTDHTVMLAILACSIAAQHPTLGLDIGRVAAFATVHDLVEYDAGDTNSFAITADARAAKEAREAAALQRLRERTAGLPWIAATIDAYEAQREPEARFVRYLDKVTPKLVHALNGGAWFRANGKSPEEVRATHDLQIAKLAAEYPEFADVVGALLEASCDYSVAALTAALARPGSVTAITPGTDHPGNGDDG